MRFPFRFPRSAALLLVWTSVILPPPASAQQPLPAALADTVPVVQVNAALETDETASKSVISQDKLARFGDTNVLDALRHVQALTTNGGVRINGNGGAMARILVDGQPAPPGFSLSNLSPQAVQRIDIYRTPTAELGGAGTGGVLNVVLARYSGLPQHRVTLSAGADGGQPNETATLLISQRYQSLDFTVSGAETRSNTTSFSHESQRRIAIDGTTLASYDLQGSTRTEYSSLSLLPRLQWHGANGDRLTAQFTLMHSVRSAQGAEGAIQTAGDDFPYTREANSQHRATDSISGFWNWTKHLAGGYVTELLGNVSAGTASGDEYFTGRDNGDTLLLQREQTQVSQSKRVRSAAKLRLPVTGGHAPVAGVELEVGHERRNRVVTDVGPLALDAADATGEARVRTDRIAAYAQDEWSLTPNWGVYLGMRWEQVGTVSIGGAAVNIDKRASVASPIAETLWKLGPSQRLRMALARSYELPPTSLLISRPHLSTINTPTMPDMTGNPDLRPSLAWQLTAGYQVEGANGQTFSLNTHWRRIDDALGQALTEIGQRWVSMPVNNRSADSHGMAADWSWKLHEAWKQAPDLELRASTAFNWSRVRGIAGPDNRLAGEIPLTLRAGIDYRSPGGAFDAGIDTDFDRGTTINQGDGQTQTAGPVRNASVYTKFKLDAHDWLSLSLSNIWRLGTVSESRAILTDESQIQRIWGTAPTQVRLSWEHRFD